ncbi:hypothetical protein Goklo_023625 [Gossypium klotzschianum]|uniref:Zinc knuckle CX2CX4HX4C domain-containing protein n=1 Tax=Gossypium klotzschianum TaxID=34286 RepID=A0A7J8TR63_9ROSI|nr:hypothetical protein [Gossypium klotzschianum]
MFGMAEDINVLLERLNFSEEESVRVISFIERLSKPQGYEAWVVGKIMSGEKVNKNAMYRVLKPLWFTKENVNFVKLKVGVILVKFGAIEDRTWILNPSPWLFDHDRKWTKYIRVRVKIDVQKPLHRVVHLLKNDGNKTICAIKYERLQAFCYRCRIISHTTKKCEKKEEHNEQNFQYGNWLQAMVGGDQHKPESTGEMALN